MLSIIRYLSSTVRKERGTKFSKRSVLGRQPEEKRNLEQLKLSGGWWAFGAGQWIMLGLTKSG